MEANPVPGHSGGVGEGEGVVARELEEMRVGVSGVCRDWDRVSRPDPNAITKNTAMPTQIPCRPIWHTRFASDMTLEESEEVEDV